MKRFQNQNKFLRTWLPILIIITILIIAIFLFRIRNSDSASFYSAQITEYNDGEETTKDITGFNTETYELETQTIRDAIAYAEIETDSTINIDNGEESEEDSDAKIKYKIDTLSATGRITYSIYYMDDGAIYLEVGESEHYREVAGELIEKLPSFYVEESFYFDLLEQIESIEVRENEDLVSKDTEDKKPIDDTLSDSMVKKIKESISSASVSVEEKERLSYKTHGVFKLVLFDDADLERCEILVYDNEEIWFQEPGAEDPYTLIDGEKLEDAISWLKAFYDF